jgi:hypothetical protein
MKAEHFLNHSCDPNVWMEDEVTLAARRDLGVGEELTAVCALGDGHRVDVAISVSLWV